MLVKSVENCATFFSPSCFRIYLLGIVVRTRARVCVCVIVKLKETTITYASVLERRLLLRAFHYWIVFIPRCLMKIAAIQVPKTIIPQIF